ncbi:MAG: ATP-binding protein [Pseudomonadota bacterium]
MPQPLLVDAAPLTPRWMPRPTLARKLFLALACLLGALLLVFVGLSRLGLQRGLGDYVAEIELSRMDWLATRLEQAYAKEASWEFLEQDPQAWFRLQMPGELLQSSGGGTRAYNSSGPPPDGPRPPDLMGANGPLGPPPGPPRDHGPGPAGGVQAQLDLLPQRHAPPPPPDAPNDPRARSDSVYARMALLDPQTLRHLAGNSIDSATAVKRPLLNGQMVVAYLAIAPLASTQTDAGRAFLAQQSTFVVVSGLVGLVLALLISWQLTRRWLAPIRALMVGAKAVAHGQLDTRVPVQGNDELATLTRTFNTMTQQLSDTQVQHQRWLADVAHELRTPLAAMRAEIEAVQDGVRPFSPPTAQRLHRQVVRLGQLVEDLRLSMNDDAALLAAALRDGVRPLDCLLEAARLMESRFQQAGLALDLAALAELAQKTHWTLRADPARLHQVFVNVLENSLQYTQQGGTVQIAAVLLPASPPAQHQPQLLIRVDDSAPAPSADDLPRLFERLYRGESSRDRKHGGSGLGMAICRAIVQAHGGRITAELSPLGGLRVSMVLPLSVNSTEGEPAT